VVPLFAVIFAGYFAAKGKMLDQREVRGLTNYIFFFALPPLLFRLMATNEVGGEREWHFLLAYLATELVMLMLGGAIARVVFKRGLAGMTIQGFGAAFSNTVLLGLPFVLWLYGDRGAVPALLVITTNVASFSLVTILLEASRGQDSAGAGRVLADTLKSILRNPILMAAGLGLAYGQFGLGLPGVVDRTLGLMGHAGAPAALFALGATLAMQRVAGTLGPAAATIVLKLFVHPLAAWILLVPLLDFPPLWANAGVLIAALPVGLNVFIFAQRYQVEVEAASTAILVSTAISMVTVTALLAVLPPVP
jgi:hypothetical protein